MAPVVYSKGICSRQDRTNLPSVFAILFATQGDHFT